MPTPDEELLSLIDRILKLVGDEGITLDRLSQMADGKKVIQYVIQIRKYNTNVGEGKDISIGDRLDRALLEDVRDLLRSQIHSITTRNRLAAGEPIASVNLPESIF